MLNLFKDLLLKIYRLIKWLTKKFFSILFTTFRDIFINTMSSVIIKKVKSYRFFINALSWIFTGTALLGFNLFGLRDVLKDSFIFQLLSNLGIISFFRIINIKIVAIYNDFVDSFTKDKEEIPSESIKQKAQKELFKDASDPIISRRDYKDAIIKVKDEEHWYYSMIAKITAMLLIGILLFFFGSDILGYLNNYKDFFKKDDDNNQNGDDQDNNQTPQSEVAEEDEDTRKRRERREEKRREYANIKKQLDEEREAAAKRLKEASGSLAQDEEFNPTYDPSLKGVGIKNQKQLDEQMNTYFGPQAAPSENMFDPLSESDDDDGSRTETEENPRRRKEKKNKKNRLWIPRSRDT